MTEREAINRVEDLRESLSLDEDMRVGSAVPAFIEYMKDRETPGRPLEARAWIVSLASRWGWANVKLDSVTGAVLDVERSA